MGSDEADVGRVGAVCAALATAAGEEGPDGFLSLENVAPAPAKRGQSVLHQMRRDSNVRREQIPQVT